MGIYRHACLHFKISYFCYRPVKMNAGLILHSQVIGSHIAESVKIPVRIYNHQVNIKRDAGDFTQGNNYRKTNGYIGHEMAVHHIHVNVISARFDRLPDLPAETAEIRG